MKENLILLFIITFGFAYNGSITGVTYFDYTRENDASSFNFNRQYFNYAIEMSNDMKFKVVFDVGRTDNGTVEFCEGGACEEKLEDPRLAVFLKKAQLDYICDWGKTSMGLIGTNTYGVQEKTWGYRFIEKSTLDKNNFISTTDLGIGFSKNLLTNLNMSVQYLNGEGYKSPEINFIQKLSLNVNYGEMNLSKNNGGNLGLVYSSELTEDSPNTMLSLYGAVALRKIRIGSELDISDGKELTSTYINYNLNRKVDFFSRYDAFDKNSENGEDYYILGIVYNCENGLLISPNYRMTIFETAEIKNEFIYTLNFQFTF